MKILSIQTDPKTSKSTSFGYLTGINYMAPFNLSGVNICPMAEVAKCHEPCLNTAGRGQTQSVQNSRLLKTKLWLKDKTAFLEQLRREIKALTKKAENKGLKPAVRLNGTSDIRWEHYGIIQEFSNVQFYDYTKILNRKSIPSNYHLTWSYSGANKEYAKIRPNDLNWAVVFKGTPPKEFLGRDVIDGDKHDLRFLDPANVVVGLKAKGKATKDTSGFVVRTMETMETKKEN